MKLKHFLALSSVAAMALAGVSLAAAPQAASQTAAQTDSTAPTPDRDTVSKPMNAKQKKKQEEKLRKELETPYRKWLNEDVTYIITDEERKAWKRLSTDDEREQFIEQFWLRRDPTPDTEENEYKEEHYRRIAYANERFASGIPGWKTDRGRIYIVYGPPDEIDDHSSGGTYDRPYEEGGGTTSTFPFVDWTYRYIEGVGTNVKIEFVDTTMSGEFRMTMDPSEKDALTYVPGAGLTLAEMMGTADKSQRFTRTDGTTLGTGTQPLPESMDEFTRLGQFANLQKAPQVKFKDLQAVVSSSIRYNNLPFKVRADYIKMTDSTILTTVTIEFQRRDLQFKQKDNVATATVNIFGRITSITGRVVNTFEDPVTMEVPASLLDKALDGASIYQKEIPLAPGMYRLNVVCKDITGGNMTTYPMALNVPHFDDEKLASSSLILADLIEKVPTRSIGTGQFVIGDTKVRPRLTDTFERNEKLGIYTQFYNFVPDEKTKKPNASIEYDITKTGGTQSVLHYSEEVTAIPGYSSQQVTVEKLLPLQSLEPGQYTLNMKVVDRNSKQTLTPTANFTIK
ncbi:MAG TPA: GWxTD domain-containing protein [Bryobacteraceae bacterium]|jgi:GWxTD domain-containing protein|nr:GWxTD domain-containing protein [Bryobacteraceae bacterium]